MSQCPSRDRSLEYETGHTLYHEKGRNPVCGAFKRGEESDLAGPVPSRLSELLLGRWVDTEDGHFWHGKWHSKLWKLEGGRRKDFRNCVLNFFMASLAGANRAFQMVGAQYVSPLSLPWFRDDGTFRTSTQGHLLAERWVRRKPGSEETRV